MSRVHVEPRLETEAHARPLDDKLERLAWLMDRAFRIPGTGITVGLDALLGLFPLGGDVLTGLVQVGLVLVALRHYHIPRQVAVRMMGNVLIDTAIGAIPFFGDLFDVAFKANTRNVKLLREHVNRRSFSDGNWSAAPLSRTTDVDRHGTPLRLLVPIAVVLLGLLVLVFIGFVTVVRWLFAL